MRKLLALLILLAAPAWAATYYVKNGGSDAASGLSDELAWETITKVNGSSFAAGDSILFKRGCTWATQLVPPTSGTAGNMITFGAYGTGVDPIFSGASVAAWQPVVGISGKEYITIDHLKFVDLTSNVFNNILVTGSTNITIQNCAFAKISAGHVVQITGNSTDVWIRNNTFATTVYCGVRINGSGVLRRIYVDDNTFADVNTSKSDGHAAVQIGGETAQNIQYVYIRRNYIDGSGTVGIGLDPNPSATAFQYLYVQDNTITNCGLDAGVGEAITIGGSHIEVSGNTITAGTGTAASGILIYLNHEGQVDQKIFKNEISGFTGSRTGIWAQATGSGTYEGQEISFNNIHDNGSGIWFNPSAACTFTASSVHNNLIYGNTAVGIFGNANAGIKVYNNTLYNNAYGIKLDGASTGWTLKNNIISTSSTYLVYVAVAAQGSFLADFNCYYGTHPKWKWEPNADDTTMTNWRTACSGEAASVLSDPLFTNTGTDDYTLAAGSPCIEKGVNLGASYLEQLLAGSTWPDSVETLDWHKTGGAPEVGAYGYRKLIW
jgi:hypothetical protein